MATNYSIYAIPACYVLANLPHAYAVSLILQSNNRRWDNSNPRSSNWNTSLQKSVPAATFARYERAEAAHKNGMENLALFASAVILGNMAKLPVSRLNAVAGIYLALRVVYTLAYVFIESKRWSLLRSVVWNASTVLLLWEIVDAGYALR